MKRIVYTLVQVLGLIAAWYAADSAAAWLGLPFSGGVVGLVAMVALLLGGVLRPATIEHGADWLLSNMLLFFIPLVVSVVQFTGLLKQDGWRLFAAIGIGFTCVMVATALTVEACRFERGRQLRRLRHERGLRAPAARARRPQHEVAAIPAADAWPVLRQPSLAPPLSALVADAGHRHLGGADRGGAAVGHALPRLFQRHALAVLATRPGNGGVSRCRSISIASWCGGIGWL
jgi:holin-like protein